jgi:predicted lipase
MSHKISYPLSDLWYATSPVLPTIQAVADKYDGFKPIYQQGVEHVGDIYRDPLRVDAEVTDLATKRLLEHVYANGTLIGGIDLDRGKGIGLISFRGTRGTPEWIKDLTFAAVPFEEVPGTPGVHLGFYKVYQSFRADLLGKLNQIPGEIKRVIISGHSLGAAVATLCLLDLVSNQADGARYEGVTFASPRVFGGGFGETKPFEKRVKKNLRIFNRADIVTNWPLSPAIPLYCHVQGGLSIGFEPDNYHSLQDTYYPYTVRVAQKPWPDGQVPLEGSDDAVLTEEFQRSMDPVAVP